MWQSCTQQAVDQGAFVVIIIHKFLDIIVLGSGAFHVKKVGDSVLGFQMDIIEGKRKVIEFVRSQQETSFRENVGYACMRVT